MVSLCRRLLLSLDRKPDGSTTLTSNGQVLWTAPAVENADGTPGAIGLLAEPHSHLGVDRFCIAGEPVEGSLAYLSTEALLGAGEKPADWQDRRQSSFRYGVGVVSRRPDARVKWNVVGRRMSLWSPRGPEFGKVEIRLDGRHQAVLDLHGSNPEPSRPVWSSGELPDAGHVRAREIIAGNSAISEQLV
jgi:hypothetical protein